MEHKHDGVIRAVVPLAEQFLFDSGQCVPAGVAHQLSIDHLPRVELEQFDVAASIDPHKRDEANTPRE